MNSFFSPSMVMAFTANPMRNINKGASLTRMNVLSSSARPTSQILKVHENKYLNELKFDKEVPRPLVVCGPSGVGKGTIISNYMEKNGGSDYFGFTVSHTTRKPRPGEIDGQHYHFVPYDEMKAAIGNDEFLEHADVHGNLYGTSYRSLKHVQEQLGKHCLLDIDIQGVQNVKQQQLLARSGNSNIPRLEPNYIFITPPSVETLHQRLVERKTESEESLLIRTKNAAKEIEYGLKAGNFDRIIVNDDLEEACKIFKETVEQLYGLS